MSGSGNPPGKQVRGRERSARRRLPAPALEFGQCEICERVGEVRVSGAHEQCLLCWQAVTLTADLRLVGGTLSIESYRELAVALRDFRVRLLRAGAPAAPVAGAEAKAKAKSDGSR